MVNEMRFLEVMGLLSITDVAEPLTVSLSSIYVSVCMYVCGINRLMNVISDP